MAMKGLYDSLYTWISVVYYYICVEKRSYNGVICNVLGQVWLISFIYGIQSPDIRPSDVPTNIDDLLCARPVGNAFYISTLVSLARGLSRFRK